MKVMFDINVVLDIVGNREPFLEDSRAAYLKAIEDGDEPMLSAHAFPTLFYLLGAAATRKQRKAAMDWICDAFSVAAIGPDEVAAARESPLADFEDALVAAAAQSAGCARIVTRNVRDYSGMDLEVQTPRGYILRGCEPHQDMDRPQAESPDGRANGIIY